ncbi:hypothetical protein C8J57DRAFT_345733 [Mycena rebaudengoi]|nr:hypothetical protein C8J57DRAFT_345733 [Mycena rebaudengoi]
MPVGSEDPCASDNERLIAALQLGFQEMARRQDEQTRSQNEQAGRLQKAIESLKPQAPIPDKKTAFWNSYMKLADEHDKEFLRKYLSDLDTALIFAGLFSAVSSAFIIQIQPELKVDPESKAPTIIIVVQSLLYASLFTTLLAALLSVLGKQWIMHYEAAGSRGAIEERGLERQRKLDGLRQWKFDTVLQMFPLLLQLALLLFSTSLSVYLWTVHHAIAIIVQTLTAFGFAAYIFLFLSAIISADSPYQTPVVHSLLPLLRPTLVRPALGIVKLGEIVANVLISWSRSTRPILPRFLSQGAPSSPQDSSSIPDWLFQSPSPEAPAVLWVLETSTDPGMIEVASEIAVDLQWPLKFDPTTTMSRLSSVFNSCFDNSLVGNEISFKVRTGMACRASRYGGAYCWLRAVSGQDTQDPWRKPLLLSGIPFLHPEGDEAAHFPQLSNLRNIMQGWNKPRTSLRLDWDDPLAVHLALRTFPSVEPHITQSLEDDLEHFLDQFPLDKIKILDSSDFANFLCCLTSFFAPVDPQVIGQLNKRYFEDDLIAQLFKALQVSAIRIQTITRVVNITARLAHRAFFKIVFPQPSMVTETFRFCNTLLRLGASLDVAVDAALLCRAENHIYLYRPAQEYTDAAKEDMGWVYVALDHVQHQWQHIMGCSQEWDEDTTQAIESLLNLLILHSGRTLPPPPSVAHTIVKALSGSGVISVTAFVLLTKTPTWFMDPDFNTIMLRSGVWAHLGRIALQWGGQRHYMEIGHQLAEMAEWNSVISHDLTTWISAFSYGEVWTAQSSTIDIFRTVLYKIWVPQFTTQYKFQDDSEQSWALALVALSNFWEAVDHNNIDEVLRLARCTVETALQVWYIADDNVALLSSLSAKILITDKCRTIFAPRLGEAVVVAAVHARNGSQLQVSGLPAGERLGQFLQTLGQKIGTELNPGGGELHISDVTKVYRNWTELKNQLLEELNNLEADLNEANVVVENH